MYMYAYTYIHIYIYTYIHIYIYNHVSLGKVKGSQIWTEVSLLIIIFLVRFL